MAESTVHKIAEQSLQQRNWAYKSNTGTMKKKISFAVIDLFYLATKNMHTHKQILEFFMQFYKKEKKYETRKAYKCNCGNLWKQFIGSTVTLF